MKTETNEEKSTRLAITLAAVILVATGADVRVVVADQIMILADVEADRDAAVAFMGTRKEFALVRTWEARGRHRATFRPAA